MAAQGKGFRIVGTDDYAAVKGQAIGKFHIGRFHFGEVVIVGCHMIFIDIGNHRGHRLQMQKRRVAFIGFGNQITAGPELRIRAGTVQETANHEGWRQFRTAKNFRNQTGGRGFSVGTGDCDTMPISHQLTQHLRSGHHWQTLLLGCKQLRIGWIDSR